MARNGMGEMSSFDHGTLFICSLITCAHSPWAVLSADDACLLAMEFNRNPTVIEEETFDICPS